MNGFDLSTIQDAYVGSANVSAIYYGSTKIWPSGPQPVPYDQQYLTFESLSNNNDLYWKNIHSGVTIYYSTDLTTWNSVTSDAAGAYITTLNNGDKVYFKGTNGTYYTTTFTTFVTTGYYNVYGNIMSLIYGDNFINKNTLNNNDNENAFEGMFYNNSYLIDASNLILPATTLSNGCYEFMFQGCTSLTHIPELPATTLVRNCYCGMFAGCTSLTTSPVLPATTLAFECYGGMFAGTAITTAPLLPVTTLATSCYMEMFEGCTSLTAAPALPATTLTNHCYEYMFKGCTSLTTAPELPATTLANWCYFGMFYDCTSLNYIKCLATNIYASDCTYNWVQNVASSGTFVRDASMTGWTIGIDGIPTNWTVDPPLSHDYSRDYLTIVSTSNNNTIGWKVSNTNLLKTISVSTNNGNTWTSYTASTSGVTLATLNNGDKLLVKGSNTAYADSSKSNYNYFTSTGNFNVEGNIMSLIYGDNFIGQTTLDSSGYNFYNLFNNCTGIISAGNLVLPTTSLTQYCYGSMFNGCTALTTAPELPATTLADGCYYYMFRECTSLTTAPELSATTLASSCYNSMLRNCTSLTTAPVLPATTLTTYCYYYMFAGCSALHYIKCLATNISASRCTTSWVSNVASSGTFVKAASMSSWRTGNNGIPSNWTIQNAT